MPGKIPISSRLFCDSYLNFNDHSGLRGTACGPPRSGVCSTPRITGKIKRSEERTELYFVRVNAFVSTDIVCDEMIKLVPMHIFSNSCEMHRQLKQENIKSVVT